MSGPLAGVTDHDERAVPPDIDIDSLVARSELGPALKRWNGFVSLLPAEQSRQARPAILVNAGGNDGWYQHVHTQTAEVREIGVYFVDNVIVSGHCYAFRDGRMLADGSEPHRVARSFAQGESLPRTELIHRQRSVVLDAPVLLIAGPGYPIWGHWLVDFLPRLAVAQEILGSDLEKFIIPLPDDVPGWVEKLLLYFCDIKKSQIFKYNIRSESLYCRRISIPNYAHSNYFFHTFVRDFYLRFLPKNLYDFPRRFCVSRRRFGSITRSAVRCFEQDVYFEETAARHGYVAIEPENLSFADQISLFAHAEAVVGESGSGMHSTLFSPEATLIGQFAMPNSIQSRIAALCRQDLAYLFADLEKNDSNGARILNISDAKIDEYFEIISKLKI